MKKFLFRTAAVLCLSAAVLFSGCSQDDDDDKSEPATPETIKLAVISDVHLYDAEELGNDSSEGTALAKYLASDRKMLVQSEAILDSALESIKNSGVKYLLISGDLTKDGEKVNHELLASKLAEVEKAGISVFVTNGNHDLSNANAVRFSGSTTERVETVDTDDFRTIYKNYGFDSSEVFAMDSESLSYSVNFGNSYRLIVMDSCIYNNDAENPSQETEGEITESEMTWIKNQIAQAKTDGRIPVGMMHHGLVEHIPEVQKQMFPEYLVDDYENVRSQLSAAGMNVVFTGHFHSQDIASTTVNGSKFYDVETGSLATSPCPVRYVTLTSGKVFTSKTSDVETVSGIDITGYDSFADYAESFLVNGMESLFESYMPALLVSQGLATEDTAEEMCSQILNTSLAADYTVCDLLTAGFVAHYKGDEAASLAVDTNAQTALATLASAYQNATDSATATLYGTLYTVVKNLYTDSETSDRDVSFTF